MNRVSNILWGFVLIIIGIIFGLNALNIADINIFFDGWWTLFIIVPCFIDLFKNESKTGNIIGLIIGVALLLSCRGILDIGMIFKLIVPFILVCIGLSIIFKDSLNKKVKDKIKSLNKNKKNDKEYTATFGEQKLDFSNEKFEGSELNAIFGGINCDLRNSTIKEDCVINASAIFGGITIRVSDNVNVKVTSNSIFGGVSDERKKRNNDSKVTLYINATCLFGGVEIK